jgi:uncharacterized protein YozE (UPF0346 family)
MKASNQKIVHIHNKSDKSALSKAQKQFNTLIKKIDEQKKLLQQWQETIPTYHHRVGSEYDTLWETYNQNRVELVHLFDAAYQNKLFTKTDKNKLKHLIDTIVTELIFEHGMEELKDLYNKYSDTDFDTDNQGLDEDVGEMMKVMFKEMLGVEIDDDVDVSSPEKMQAALQAKLAEHENQQQEKTNKRKKTAKQLEKEAKLEQEAQHVSKSIQEVYRKLVSSLHPDREPDEAERERKTKIMQEVNVAYSKKDLLRLLELQIELEHIDEAHLNNLGEDRLKYFNKVLQDQLKELQQEIDWIERGFKMQLNWAPFLDLSPEKVLAKLEYDIQSVARDIARLKTDIEKFQFPPSLKVFLKTYKIPKQAKEPSLEDFEDLFFR